MGYPKPSHLSTTFIFRADSHGREGSNDHPHLLHLLCQSLSFSTQTYERILKKSNKVLVRVTCFGNVFVSIMNTNKLELPNNNILNFLNLNKGQRSEMKRFFKEHNELPEGPKEGDFEDIMMDILNPASYSIEGYEVGSIIRYVTSVEIQNHKWKNHKGKVVECKKIVIKSDDYECEYDSHLELLVKYDDNEPYLVLRVVNQEYGPVEVQLKYDNMFEQLVDVDIDPELKWVSVWEI